jgi:hypothetical protein
VDLPGQICLPSHRTRIDIVLFSGLFQKKVIERSVWIDGVAEGEQYEVQKISNTAAKISTASDLTTTTIASCVSSLRPSNKTLPSVHQVNDSPA